MVCIIKICSPVFDTTALHKFARAKSKIWGLTYPPGVRAAGKTRPGGLLRESHPSEDLSELPPLRAAVAGQGYHYRRMWSLRDSLPKLLMDGWVPLCTLLAVFYETIQRRFSLSGCPAGGLCASSESLLPLDRAHPLMLFCCRIFCCQGSRQRFAGMIPL